MVRGGPRGRRFRVAPSFREGNPVTEYIVGLDVHAKQSTFVIERTDGTVVARGAIPTSREGLRSLIAAQHLPPKTRVGLETGTQSFFVARELMRLEMSPLVIDAHEVRLKAQRPTQKCDRRDAFEICDGVRRGIYRTIVHVPPLAISALRDTLSRRRHFVRKQADEIIAAKRLVRAAGLSRRASASLRTPRGWSCLLRSLQEHPELRALVELHFCAWQHLAGLVTRLDLILEGQLRPHHDTIARLDRVPGVGRVIAATTLAVFSDPTRFPSSKQAASYAGLVPQTYQSSDRDARGHITKRGSAELRAMLCEAAHHARRPSHPLQPYFVKLCAKRGYKLAVVAVAHRLCRILFRMLRDGSEFDVQRLGVEVGPFERKLTRLYRLKPQPT